MPQAAPDDDHYLVLLRRELVRAQARLKRAEEERDILARENARLRARLAAASPAPAGNAESQDDDSTGA